MSAINPLATELVNYNTLRLRSSAAQFVELNELSELAGIIAAAKQKKMTLLALGEGSNVVLGARLKALVVKINTRGYRLLHSNQHSVSVQVAAGEGWHQFVQTCLAKGWHGLENLALIPGTIGAAPMQNIGAYGVEVGEFIERVHFVELPGYSVAGDTSLHVRVESGCSGEYSIAGSACEFGYRDSIFKRRLRDKVLVTAVTFKLATRFTAELGYPALREYLQDKLEIASQAGEDKRGAAKTVSANVIDARALFDAVVEIRRAKLPDPTVIANAGSFFKNPIVDRAVFEVFIRQYPQAPYFPMRSSSSDTAGGDCFKIPAAWLIEQCGFKGSKHGDIGMHAGQALVLVNLAPGQVSGEQVIEFAGLVMRAVAEKFSLQLEIEPRRYGC